MKNKLTNNFSSKYPNILKNKHEFSVSKAVMSMIESNVELNKFLNGDFVLAVNFATTAWNLAIINDPIIISLLVKEAASPLQKQAKKSLKQTEIMLMSLVRLKNKLYGMCIG